MARRRSEGRQNDMAQEEESVVTKEEDSVGDQEMDGAEVKRETERLTRIRR